MVPPLSVRVPRVRTYSGFRRVPNMISPTGLSPPPADFPKSFGYLLVTAVTVRTPTVFLRPVWPLSLSLATTREISFDFFSSPYLDVSVRGVPRVWLLIHQTLAYYVYARFPHSDTHGSRPICGSPWLFAAYRVLLRLLTPRHSPCALFSLNY